MIDSDLIIPPPIPFADTTIGELEEASKIFNVPTNTLVEEIIDGVRPERINPQGVYERYYIPTGNLIIDFSKLKDAAYDAAVADTIKNLQNKLNELEQAVLTEDAKTLTKTGRPGGSAYMRNIAKMRTWLEDPIGRKPPYAIFAKGNQKLPFWTFSTLPDVTCPGAGDCLVDPQDKSKRGWCYSFSSWHKVTPFMRQLQNTLLIRIKDKSWIEADAKKKFKKGEVVRLYVDGDMDSKATITYWMHFCERFPQNKFYGYSKSWGLFKSWHTDNGGKWPSNYVMNLSSGTKLERILTKERFQAVVKEMLSLRNPQTGHRLVRGTFRALEVASKSPGTLKRGKKAAQKWTAHRQEVLDEAKKAGIRGDFSAKGVFVCPGYCGKCLKNGGHACGDKRMEDMAIVIGIH
jgi:hypothetical protein